MPRGKTDYRITAEFSLAFYRERPKWVQKENAFRYTRVVEKNSVGTVDGRIVREEFLSARSDKEILGWLNKNGRLALDWSPEVRQAVKTLLAVR